MIHDKLNELITENFGQLSQQELAMLSAYFHAERLEKHAFFLREGATCNRLSFLMSGILRVYSISDGLEYTQWVCSENSLVTDITGFFFDQPNGRTIQAICDTTLLTITKQRYRRLCKEFCKMAGD